VNARARIIGLRRLLPTAVHKSPQTAATQRTHGSTASAMGKPSNTGNAGTKRDPRGRPQRPTGKGPRRPRKPNC
jgi:hypothetical protein